MGPARFPVVRHLIEQTGDLAGELHLGTAWHNSKHSRRGVGSTSKIECFGDLRAPLHNRYGRCRCWVWLRWRRRFWGRHHRRGSRFRLSGSGDANPVAMSPTGAAIVRYLIERSGCFASECHVRTCAHHGDDRRRGVCLRAQIEILGHLACARSATCRRLSWRRCGCWCRSRSAANPVTVRIPRITTVGNSEESTGARSGDCDGCACRDHHQCSLRGGRTDAQVEAFGDGTSLRLSPLGPGDRKVIRMRPTICAAICDRQEPALCRSANHYGGATWNHQQHAP